MNDSVQRSPSETETLLGRLLIDWVKQYLAFLDHAPGALPDFAAMSSQFVRVPIPRALLQRLRDDARVPDRGSPSVPPTSEDVPVDGRHGSGMPAGA